MDQIKKIFCFLFIIYAYIEPSFAIENKFSTDEVEKFVLDARDFAIREGKEKALKAFMDPNNNKFRKGPLYIFAYNNKGICLAHIKASMIGSNMLNFRDQNGVAVIREILEIVNNNEKGGWKEYIWSNPSTDKIEEKYSFSIKVRDDWFIGSGIFASEKK